MDTGSVFSDWKKMINATAESHISAADNFIATIDKVLTDHEKKKQERADAMKPDITPKNYRIKPNLFNQKLFTS